LGSCTALLCPASDGVVKNVILKQKLCFFNIAVIILIGAQREAVYFKRKKKC